MRNVRLAPGEHEVVVTFRHCLHFDTTIVAGVLTALRERIYGVWQQYVRRTFGQSSQLSEPFGLHTARDSAHETSNLVHHGAIFVFGNFSMDSAVFHGHFPQIIRTCCHAKTHMLPKGVNSLCALPHIACFVLSFL